MIIPIRRTPEKIPQRLVPFVLAPLFLAMGLLLLMSSSASLPVLLLLRQTGEVPALALLRAYRTFYRLIMTLSAVLPLLYLALTLWIGVRLSQKEGGSSALTPFCTVAALLFMLVCVLSWLVVQDSDYSRLYDQAEADIQQIEAGSLERMAVTPGQRRSSAPMPGGSTRNLPLTRWSVIGPGSSWTWQEIYFPKSLDFQPDSDQLFSEGHSIDWNSAHRLLYDITYTSNFRLVVSAVPAEGTTPTA